MDDSLTVMFLPSTLFERKAEDIELLRFVQLILHAKLQRSGELAFPFHLEDSQVRNPVDPQDLPGQAKFTGFAAMEDNLDLGRRLALGVPSCPQRGRW